MKYLIPIFCLIAFANCGPRLDQPEHQQLLLDIEKNPNLKVSVEAFLENPTNESYLEKHCVKVKSGGTFDFIYSKDSTFIQIKNNVVTESKIVSTGDFLNYGIKIGQKRSDFIATFPPLFNRPQNPYIAIKADKIEISCCSIAKSVWSFNFENDVLKSVTFVQSMFVE